MDDKLVKDDLQKQIDNLVKQAENLKIRRGELSAELEKTANDTQTNKQALGANMLEGRDFSRGIEDITREKVKIDGLKEALSQADMRMGEIERQIAKTKVDLAMVDFNRLASEADVLLVAAFDDFYSALGNLEALNEKMIELHHVGGEAKTSPNDHDHLRHVKGIEQLLSDTNIAQRLKHAEETLPAVLAEARAKRGKLIQ